MNIENMRDNVIMDGFDNTIGFYDDVKRCIISQIETELKSGNYEVLGDEWRDMLESLENFKEYSGLVIVSDNNGMGYTVRKYEFKES